MIFESPWGYSRKADAMQSQDSVLRTAEHVHPTCSAKLNGEIHHSNIRFEQRGKAEKSPIIIENCNGHQDIEQKLDDCHCVGMIINLVGTVIVVVGIIWLVIWWVRKSIPNNQVHSTSPRVNPREILQARYARGEINREQYQQILEDLG